jgi:hypothetical protein
VSARDRKSALAPENCCREERMRCSYTAPSTVSLSVGTIMARSSREEHILLFRVGVFLAELKDLRRWTKFSKSSSPRILLQEQPLVVPFLKLR